MPHQLSSPRVFAALLTLTLLATACASASGIRLGDQVFPPRSEDHPIPVFEPDRVPRAHDRIGRIVGEGSDLVGLAEILEPMRVEARALGADALILLGGGLLAEFDEEGELSFDRSVHAIAIRWR